MIEIKPSAILRGALRRLEVHGWIQSAAGNMATGYCSMGAINAATLAREQFPGDLWHAYDLARNYVIQVIDYPGVAIWNDSPDRTREDVILAFKRAIELAEADEQ